MRRPPPERLLLCQRPLTRKQTLWGGGALVRGHGAPLEPLAQLRDALGGVGATAAQVEAAELVVGQTAMEGGRASCGEGGQLAVVAEPLQRSGGALERGHGAPLEPLAQLRDALGGVGATAAQVEAAELVVGQTAMGWAILCE